MARRGDSKKLEKNRASSVSFLGLLILVRGLWLINVSQGTWNYRTVTTLRMTSSTSRSSVISEWDVCGHPLHMLSAICMYPRHYFRSNVLGMSWSKDEANLAFHKSLWPSWLNCTYVSRISIRRQDWSSCANLLIHDLLPTIRMCFSRYSDFLNFCYTA